MRPKGTHLAIQTQFVSVTHDVMEVCFSFADKCQATRVGVGKQPTLSHALSQHVVLFPAPGGWVAEDELYAHMQGLPEKDAIGMCVLDKVSAAVVEVPEVI
jgi:hypothetical protein